MLRISDELDAFERIKRDLKAHCAVDRDPEMLQIYLNERKSPEHCYFQNSFFTQVRLSLSRAELH